MLWADIIRSGSTVPLDKHFAPLLEPELVFRLRDDIHPEASLEEVASKCDVAAGLECPDSRYCNWFGGQYPALTLRDLIADNCLAGLLVVGDTWLPATEVHFPTVTAVLLRDGVQIATGDGTGVLGNPLKALIWLSRHLAERGGVLSANTLVSSGTFTAPFVATPSLVTSSFSEGIGDVSIRWT